MKVPRIPPGGFALVALAAQEVLLRRSRPTPTSTVLAGVVGLPATWLVGSAGLRFLRAGTTTDPVHADRGSTLVTEGANELSRNPMYVGMVGMLVAQAIFRRSGWALLPAVAFVTLVDRVQIPVEEAAMRARFGAEYDAYTQRVPRWLDRRSLERLRR